MLTATVTPTRITRTVHVRADGASLAGELALPQSPRGIVVFVQRGNFSAADAADHTIALAIEHAGFALLRLDLLTPYEELVENATGGLANDIALLSRRLIETLDWVAAQPSLVRLPVGVFVTGSAAGAALVASVVEEGRIAAIVSTAARVHRATLVLPRVTTPTLLIVASDDRADTHECEAAFRQIPNACEMILVHGTTSRADVAAAAADISRHTVDWFDRHLTTAAFEP